MQKELDALVREVLPLDRSAMTAAEAYQARLAKPPGSLGRLEEISIQLAGITGRVHNALNKSSCSSSLRTTAWWPRAFPARRSP